MKSFEKLTQDELWTLRQQITLNSHYFADYENSFGFDSHSICCFFEGYYDYICELAEECYADSHKVVTHEVVISEFDNKDNLLSWFNCYDDLSWVV